MATVKCFLSAVVVAVVLSLNGCGGGDDGSVTPAPHVIPATTPTTTSSLGWQPCHGPGACCMPALKQMCPGTIPCSSCGSANCQCPTPPTTPEPVPGWEPCSEGACCDPADPLSVCAPDIACQFCGAVACQCPLPPTTTGPPTSATTTRSTTTWPAGKCALEFSPCGGGDSYTGPSCCVDGLICWKVDAYYSHCANPDTVNTTTTTFTGSTTTRPAGECALEFSQCGGDDSYTGPSCCVDGLICSKNNGNYAYCTNPEMTNTTTSAMPSMTGEAFLA